MQGPFNRGKYFDTKVEYNNLFSEYGIKKLSKTFI